MNNPAFPDRTLPNPQKLNLSTKLAYGAGDLGPAITANILAVFLLIFFTNVAGLPPGTAGSILLISKIWDAINDPIIGWLSDRTSSRWGRRHPWMLFGAIPFGLFFFLQWVVPRFSDNPNTNQWGLFWYYVAIAFLFNNFYTAVNLPYTTLTAELTQDYDERTSLNSFRFAFSIGGSIFSLLLALGIFNLIQNNPTRQYLVLGGVCAVISVLPIYWCVWGTHKRVQEAERQRQETVDSSDPIPYFQQLKIAFSNRPFLYVIGIYLCSWLAVQNTVAVIPYFVKNWMGLTDQDFTKVVMAVQVTGLIMLFVWSAVSRRVGKKAVYFMGMTLWIIAEVGLFFLQPGQVGLMYFLAVLAGFGVATAYLIPWSMIPDVIELDELHTGQRREGIFYGFMVLLQKVALAIGLFLVGVALQYSGFISTTGEQPAPTQPESALWAIRLLIGPIPTVILLIGLFLAYLYPITREVHTEILLQLQERKRADSSGLPVKE
ncbi:MAG: MFS transporter [Leptolyngbyaceae cyanobacterium HOT.MB2.61]|jgi:GPH family glycoside/pentoside/hexuronide:cation symporter|nr:MFS transporter [Leptolyngbyaceae cyanobacterium HOT.MB2.61]